MVEVQEEKGGVLVAQRKRTKHGVWVESERGCQWCQKMQPLVTFSQREGKDCDGGKVCRECEQYRQYERHCRVTAHREMWQHPDREERRQKTWERRVALRQAHKEHAREQEQWYQHQPDRSCQRCRQILPASAF